MRGVDAHADEVGEVAVGRASVHFPRPAARLQDRSRVFDGLGQWDKPSKSAQTKVRAAPPPGDISAVQ